MYIPDLGNLCDSTWDLNSTSLIKIFKECSDFDLAYECELLGECYRAWDNSKFDGIPCFIPFLDAYERCLFYAVAQRFVDIILFNKGTSPDFIKEDAFPA